MAIVVPSGAQVCDSGGNPVSGAKIRVYTANTTTLATLYSDAALTVSLPNPVICSSSGYPTSNGTATCNVFAGVGTYDMAFLDASNAVLASFDDTPGLGTEASDVSRTLADSTRLKISGAAGVVKYEVGDASPDNTGGTARFGGWAGTQGDAASFDFAASTFSGTVDATGLIVGGQTVPAVISSGTASAVASLTITIPSGLRSYTIELVELVGSTTAAVFATVSINSASSYVASGYSNSFLKVSDATAQTGVLTTSAYATVANLQTSAGVADAVSQEIDTPLSGTGNTVIRGRTNVAGDGYLTTASVAAGGRITNVKYTPSSGTFSCKWRLRSRGA